MTEIPTPPPSDNPPFPHRWLWTLLGGLAILHLLTLPDAHLISDSYEWIGAIRRGAARDLFHPHHLIYNAVAWAWSRPLVALGMDLWTAVQLLSVLGGLAGSAAFFLCVWHMGRDRHIAAAATLAWNGTFVTWLFSTDVEVYIFTVAGLLWSFSALLWAVEAPCWRRFFVVGVVCGVAGLFHQTACLFLLPAALAALWGNSAWPVRLKRAFMPLVGFALSAGVPYILVGVTLFGVRGPAALFVWMTKHAQYGYYGGFSTQTPLEAVVGFGRSLMFGSALVRPDMTSTGHGWREWLTAGGMLLVAICLAWLFTSAVQALRNPDRRLRQALLLAAGWFGANAAFSLYYEPQNVEWWVLPMAPFFLWITGGALYGRKSRGISALLLLAIILHLANGASDMLPRREASFDPFFAAARTLEATAGDEAAFIVAPSVIHSRLRQPALNLQITIRERGDDVPAAMRNLADRVERTLRAGHPVLLTGEPLRPAVYAWQPHARPAVQAYRRITTRHGTPAGAIRIPWDEATPGQPARWRRMQVYRLSPEHEAGTAWVEAIRAWADHAAGAGATP